MRRSKLKGNSQAQKQNKISKRKNQIGKHSIFELEDGLFRLKKGKLAFMEISKTIAELQATKAVTGGCNKVYSEWHKTAQDKEGSPELEVIYSLQAEVVPKREGTEQYGVP